MVHATEGTARLSSPRTHTLATQFPFYGSENCKGTSEAASVPDLPAECVQVAAGGRHLFEDCVHKRLARGVSSLSSLELTFRGS